MAIPGEVAGLLEAHARFGKLPRADVLAMVALVTWIELGSAP